MDEVIQRPAAPLSDPGAVPDGVVVDALGSHADRGLTASEADERLQRHGRNVLREAPPVPLWRRVLAQFRDPLVYLLLVAVAISLGVWIIEGAHGVPVDVVVIAAIIIANAGIGLVQEHRADEAVAALARMTAATSTVVRDGTARPVPSEELVPGDLLLLAEGDAVGADARLLAATGLKIQEAALTGESAASVKDPSVQEPGLAVGDRSAMVFKGTAVAEGSGRAVVTATGMDTEMGSIADMLEAAEQAPSPLQIELNRVSKALGLIVMAIAALVMAVLWLISRPSTPAEMVDILLLGVSLAVAAVPEGLVAILSLVLALGVRTMAAQRAVMKRLSSVETLGSASVICSDKTGTLTRNEMTLRTIVTASGRVELTGTGYATGGSASVVSGDPDVVLAETRLALVGGAVANNAALGSRDDDWQIRGDPTEAAFLVAQHKLEGVAASVAGHRRRGEVPFTSDRKLMSVVSRHADHPHDLLHVKGAPDVLLQRCTHWRVGDEAVVLDDTARAGILGVVEELSGHGYRTLGVAYRVLDPAGPVDSDHPDADAEHHLTWVAVVGIIDPARDEATAAVAEAHRAGIRTVMITGDHPATAARIAGDLGVTGPGRRAYTGVELDRLDDAGFARAVGQADVFARVAPKHKLRIVGVLQADGHIVAMTGDGVNDAPALKSADIGVAMGITGTEVSKQAADMILGDDNFATIVAAVRQGRVIFDNIAKFLRYLLSSNMGEVVTVFAGVVFAQSLGLRDAAGALVLPLLATQILWINLVTDSAPALAMGVDPEIDDVMARAPRPRAARIIGRGDWVRIVWVGVVMAVATLATIDLFLPGGLLPGGSDVATARTAGFTTLVFAQLINAFCARSASASAFRRVWVNRWLWAATAAGVLLQVAVVEVPWLQVAFGTRPLSLSQWLVCLAMASIVLWAQELVKAVLRRRGEPARRTAPGVSSAS